MHDLALTLFWATLALLGYTYIGYGLLVRAWAAARRRPVIRGSIRPTVTVIVVIHNEAARVRQRIANLLALDYPDDRLDILVASDGSTDDGARLAAGSGSARVRVRQFAERRGKPSVLNDVLPEARGEIVVLADARQRFDPHAVTALVERFADPQVGAVSGELHFSSHDVTDAAVEGTAMYWSLERRIRDWESRVDSSIGATGAIYAIRRRLFEPLAADTLLDDVTIPLRIARRGYRVAFEPSARAFDRVAETARQEYARKVRTIAGTFQLFARERWLLVPSQNRLWLQTLSHKGLRLMLPCLYLLLFASTALLAGAPIYRWALAAQVVFYGAALLAILWPDGRRRPILMVPYTVGFLTWATIVGFLRFVTGRQRPTWERPLTSLPM